MSDRGEKDRADFSVGRVTRFYVPLLMQAFSQSISYPLVGGITTHGPLGVNGLTAFAQGQTIMFMIGSLGGGLVMTGMVHARTGGGYLAFRRLNLIMMAALLLLQCLRRSLHSTRSSSPARSTSRPNSPPSPAARFYGAYS